MKLEQITEIYTEERDCGAEPDLLDCNSIKLETVSNGIANYLVFSTERWAVDKESLQELVAHIQRLLNKVNN
jgi:hypothetical protein